MIRTHTPITHHLTKPNDINIMHGYEGSGMVSHVGY